MTEYTPTTNDVREFYQGQLEKTGENIYTFVDEEECNAQFDRWLAGVKAEAWDEGHNAGWESRHDDAIGGFTPSGSHESDAKNPYRGEQA